MAAIIIPIMSLHVSSVPGFCAIIGCPNTIYALSKIQKNNVPQASIPAIKAPSLAPKRTKYIAVRIRIYQTIAMDSQKGPKKVFLSSRK